MKVYNHFNRRPTEAAPSGEKKEPKFRMVIDETGHKIIVPDGTHDIYESIQSYKEETDIHNIIARAMAGEDGALMQRAGSYGDLTGMPATLAEAQNAILRMTEQFEQLPAAIREKFNNSPEQFVAQYGTSEFLAKMGIESKADVIHADQTKEGGEKTE